MNLVLKRQSAVRIGLRLKTFPVVRRDDDQAAVKNVSFAKRLCCDFGRRRLVI